ncbi:MAG: acetyl-CoA carboxylase biotin carboxyl carrier protein subunit [Bacteroidales bacterium]|nr:acetyl-CoA carboxylase biotin carboxyl carrier protein subunit [Bacteroidales bacterium]
MKAYKFKIGGNQYDVTVNGIEGKIADVTVNGVNYQVELENEVPAAAPAAAPSAAAAPAAAAPAAAPKPAGAGKIIGSPLPGVIISVDVKEGQAVKRGQKVAVIEAMKMENEILAECDGTITAIHVSKGDSVLEGADIVTIG